MFPNASDNTFAISPPPLVSFTLPRWNFEHSFDSRDAQNLMHYLLRKHSGKQLGAAVSLFSTFMDSAVSPSSRSSSFSGLLRLLLPFVLFLRFPNKLSESCAVCAAVFKSRSVMLLVGELSVGSWQRESHCIKNVIQI